jgi:hypothetical protein
MKKIINFFVIMSFLSMTAMEKGKTAKSAANYSKQMGKKEFMGWYAYLRQDVVAKLAIKQTLGKSKGRILPEWSDKELKKILEITQEELDSAKSNDTTIKNILRITPQELDDAIDKIFGNQFISNIAQPVTLKSKL